jgi:hypothetical protein
MPRGTGQRRRRTRRAECYYCRAWLPASRVTSRDIGLTDPRAMCAPCAQALSDDPRSPQYLGRWIGVFVSVRRGSTVRLRVARP